MKYLKNTVITLLLTASVLCCSAQTFLKYFAIDSAATIGLGIQAKGGNLYVSGALTDTANASAIKSYMAKFDQYGNLLWSNTYRPSRFASYYFLNQSDLIQTTDNGFAAAGSATDTSGVDSVLFSKFDTSGNLLFYKTYAPAIPNYLHTYGLSIVECDSAYYIIGDVQLADYYVALMLIKTDLSGNLLFIKIYQNLPLLYGNSNASICKLPGDKLLVAEGRTDGTLNYWQTDYSTCYLELDTGGNITHQFCTTDSNTQAYQQIATTYDGNYLSCGSYYQLRGQSEGSELDINYLAKLDTNFNTIWQLKTGGVNVGNTFTDFKQDNNNNIILCGQDPIGQLCCAMMEDVIYKVDSMGNVLWSRRYMVPTGLNPDYSGNYLAGVDLLPNGDIGAVGTWQSSTNNSPLNFLETAVLLLIDSNGCLADDDCGLSDDISGPPVNKVDRSEILRVFPNPSNGIFTVNAMVGLPAATTIDIYDALGRKLHSQLLFNHSNLINLYYLPSGIYFYKVGNGLVNVGEGKLVIQK